MIDTKKARFTINSLHFNQLDKESYVVKLGLTRQFRPISKRLISKVEVHQPQIQIRSNLLNKETSSNNFQKNIHRRGKTIELRTVSLNLPQIGYSPIKTQAEDFEQKEVDIVSYSSGKLNHHRDRFGHNFKERYYKKIEGMKEIKVPIFTQQVFAIPQSSNKTLASFFREVDYTSESQKTHLINRKALTNATLQKYQILRKNQQVQIPKQLQAKKCHSRYGKSTIATQSKNAIRFKFDSMLAKERKSIMVVPQHSDRRQLQGWESESRFGFEHQLQFD